MEKNGKAFNLAVFERGKFQMSDDFESAMDDHLKEVVEAWRAHQANLVLRSPDHPLRAASYQRLVAAQDRFARLTLQDETNPDSAIAGLRLE